MRELKGIEKQEFNYFNEFSKAFENREEEEKNLELGESLKGETWVKKNNYKERNIQRVESARQIEKVEGIGNILDNEVMKALFDQEMCIVCKYQRSLFRDYMVEI